MNDRSRFKIVLPENEDERIEMLKSLGVLDTAPENLFDDLVHLAAQISDSPISVISLVDRDRQWFKAKVGIAADSTARDISFCTHTILNDAQEPFIVENALTDSRFSHNPLVTGDMGVRFYVGFPLVLFNEFSVGSLCVIGHNQKSLSQDQLDLLSKLADIATRRLEALAPSVRSGLLANLLRSDVDDKDSDQK